jgi:stringent starvation protein B
MNALDSTSTRPYLVRALYDWCTDNGFTPYVAVAVDDSVQVPREYVKNNEIVLNISFDATSSLKLGNDFIEFKARFAGTARDIMVPIGRVVAIYARENGQGMAFPLASADSLPLLPPANASVAAPESQPEPSLPSLSSVASTPPVAPQPHAGDGKVVQLVPVDASSDAPNVSDAGEPSGTDRGDTDPPQPPKPRQGARPSLKRVK